MSLSFSIVDNKIKIILLPETPTINSITYTTTTTNTIIISWNNLSNLLTYNLICSDNTLSVNRITSNSPSVTIDGSIITYTITTSVITGYNYKFSIVSVASDGTMSLSSPSKSITILLPLSQPTIDKRGSSYIVSWIDITGAISYNLICSDATLNVNGINTNSYTFIDGTLGSSYTFTVVAVASDGTQVISPVSNSILITVISITPIAVLSESSIDVSWIIVPDATSYSLSYTGTSITGINGSAGTASTGSTGKYSSSGKRITYTIESTTLTSGNSYVFTITVIKGSTNSISVSDSITYLSKPSMPTVNITPGSSNTTIGISWTAVNGATSYDLNYTIIPLGVGVTISNSSNPTSSPTTITAILGNSYIFSVTAKKNSSGSTSYSLPSPYSSSVTALNIPSTPVASLSSIFIFVKWLIVTGANSYNLYYTGTTNPITPNPIIITSFPGGTSTPSSSSASNDGIYVYYNFSGTIGNSYTFYVVAIASDNSLSYNSSSSNSITIMNIPSTPVASLSGSSIIIYWPKVTGANSYNLYYNGTTNPNIPNPINITSFPSIDVKLNPNLNPKNPNPNSANDDGTNIYYKFSSGTIIGNSYTFNVVAVASDGTQTSNSSTSNSIKILEVPVLTVSNSNTSITINWIEISNSTSYNLYYTKTDLSTTPATVTGGSINGIFKTSNNGTISSPNSGGLAVGTLTTTGTNPVSYSYAVTGSYGYPYSFTVSAVLNGVPTSLSSEAKITPLVKPSISISALGTAVTISWDPITGATSYTLTPTPGTTITNVTSPSTFYGIVNNTYTFTITAIANDNSSITSDQSTSIAVLDKPTISSVSASGTTVTIRWDPITNATSYDLYVSTGSIINNVNSPYYYIGTVGTIYTFQVTAKANLSTSIISNSSASIAVLDTPTNFSASASGTTITIIWNAVTNATTYTLNYNILSPTSSTGSISGIQSSSSTPATSGTASSGSAISAGQISFASSTYTYTITGTAGTTYNFTVTANATPSTSAPTASSANVVVTAGVTTITPLTVGSGLILWLDGKDPAATGTSPTASTTYSSGWIDKSGSGNHTTIYSVNTSSGSISTSGVTIDYNQSYGFTIPPLTSNLIKYFYGTISPEYTGKTLTIFVVCKPNNAGGGGGNIGTAISLGYNSVSYDGIDAYNETITTGGTLDYILNHPSSTVPYTLIFYRQNNNKPSNVPGGPKTTGVSVLNECWFDGDKGGYCTAQYGNSTTIVNDLSSDSRRNFKFSKFMIGTSYNLSCYFDGQISEVLVYTSYLSQSDRQKIEGYLSCKWGLQQNLPSSHPFKLKFYLTFDNAVSSTGGTYNSGTIYIPNNVPGSNNTSDTTGSLFKTLLNISLSSSVCKYGTNSLKSNYGAIRNNNTTNPYVFPENTGLTFTIWANISTHQGYPGALFSFADSTGFNTVSLKLNPSATSDAPPNGPWFLTYQVDDGNGSNNSGNNFVDTTRTNNPIYPDVWNHYAWTISPAAYGAVTTYTFYINNQQVATLNNSSTIYPKNYERKLIDIAAQAGFTGLNGYFDTFRCYETALSSTQINNIYTKYDPNNIMYDPNDFLT